MSLRTLRFLSTIAFFATVFTAASSFSQFSFLPGFWLGYLTCAIDAAKRARPESEVD